MNEVELSGWVQTADAFDFFIAKLIKEIWTGGLWMAEVKIIESIKIVDIAIIEV